MSVNDTTSTSTTTVEPTAAAPALPPTSESWVPVIATDSVNMVASARKPRSGKPPESKQARLIALLKRKRGASIDDMVAATGWQAHSVRGAISGALKKKLGLSIVSEMVSGRGRVYRIQAIEV